MISEPLRAAVQGRTLVLKLGGSVGKDDTLPEDVTSLQQAGARVVIVHGGGPMITAWLDKTGKETRFVNGLRYTDEETLQVVRMVLGGLVNGEVVARIQGAGGRSIGLSGGDDRLLRARVKDPELGLVGEVFAVNPQPIEMALNAGYIVVIAPVALTDDSQYLNVNADTAAGEVALAIEADALLFLTDVPGISDGTRSLPKISAGEASALIDGGVINGGMVPKVAACIRAAAPDRLPLIVDGRRPHVVIEALLGAEGVGTLFQPDL